MCGVVAIIDLAPGLAPLSDSAIGRAVGALSHRGPDASGVLRLANGTVVLGHRRLSIVNLGRDGDQPMTDAHNRVAVSFNGEIYNHAELRRRLESDGARFRSSNSDTEVLIHGYLHWGWDALLERLHGMFAFVLWDDASRKLLAVRDRLGIKPLYYAQLAGRLVLASEAKAITHLPGFAPKMNDAACLDLLNVLATPPPMTMFDGIFKLSAGSYLHVNPAGSLSKHRYWRPPTEPSSAGVTFAEAAAEVEALARQAVLDRLPNEVQAGVMLSGGVDSGFILGAAAAAGHHLRAFTASFDGDPLDEFTEAHETARHFGCEHIRVEIAESEAMAATLTLMQDMDEPIADSACLPLQYLSVRAKAEGIKVAFVGEGADELFCGYPAWRVFINERTLWRTIASLRRLHGGRAAEGAASALGAALPWTWFGLVGAMDIAASVARGHGRFRSGAESMRPSQIARILKPKWVPSATADDPAGGRSHACASDSLSERLALESGGYPDSLGSPEQIFRNLRRRNLGFRLPELLLMRVDKITMASSIEARVPFLDHRLVEYVLRLPESIVLDARSATTFGGVGNKPLLRAAASKVLPTSVVTRKKVGLGAPLARWLRGPLGAELEAIAMNDAASRDSPLCPVAVQRMFRRHRSGERDYSSYLWPIANLALWRHRWLRAR